MMRNKNRCPNCGSKWIKNFCADCGQKALNRSDFTLRALFADLFFQFFGENSRLYRTIRDFVNAGVYPRNWLNLKRQRYISPVKFFLIINLLYFLFLPLGGFDGFTSPFQSQLNSQFYSESISPTVTHIISKSGLSSEQFVAEFNSRVTGISNSLLILMVPIVSFWLFLINLRKSRRAYHHLITGLCFSSYILFLAWTINLLLALAVQLNQWFDLSLVNYFNDASVSIVKIIVTLFYGYFFFKRLYNDSFWINAPKAIFTAFFVLSVSMVTYRFLLLWITLYSVVFFP